MTLLLFTPVISIWKVCPGASSLPVQSAQTHASPGALHPEPSPCPGTRHRHTSSARSRLSQSLGDEARFGGAHLLCLWTRRLKSAPKRSLVFAAPGLRFYREVRASSRGFRQLSASRPWNISLLSATNEGSQFLLYLQKIKPEEVAQSNSNSLSRLQPNGHN